jgi:regulator of protease activity HflC (stomatin/prohibitin superfamily)
METTVVILALLALTLLTLFKGVRQVPQGSKWVVQRLGKYHKTLNPGLNFIIPFFDVVAYRVTTKDIVLDIPSQEVITRDNVVIIVNAVAYINILLAREIGLWRRGFPHRDPEPGADLAALDHRRNGPR